MSITIKPETAQMGRYLTISLPENSTCRVQCYLGRQAITDGTYRDIADILLEPDKWLTHLPTCADTRTLDAKDAPWVEIEIYDLEGQYKETVEKRFDIVVGKDFAPELNWVLSPVNTLSQVLEAPFQNMYFQGVSQVQADFEVRCWEGASLSKITLEAQGKTYEAASGSLVSQVLTAMGNLQVTVSATDSRGLTTCYQETITITPYARPVVALGEQGVFRCDPEGNADPGGSCLYVHAAATVFPLAGENRGHLSCRVYPVGTTPGDFSSLETAIVPGAVLLPEYSYILELLPYDRICQGAILQLTIPKEMPYAHQTDEGLALGMYRDKGGLEVAWPVHLHSALTLGGTTLTEDTLKKLLKLL